MRIFKKRVSRRIVNRRIKELTEELKEHNASWNPKKPPRLASQKRKFFQTQYQLTYKIEGLKELL